MGRAPWVITWDDHEVDNDHAGDSSENDDDPAEFRARRAVAYQAWYEHMPVRLPPPDLGPEPDSEYRIYRDIRWGTLAHFFVLDGRQYRDDQPTDGEFVPVPGVFEDPSVPIRPIGEQASDPGRTMLGRAQEDWLVDGATSSPAQWKVLVQQVMMHGLSIVPGAVPPMTATDTWDGYHGNRMDLLTRLASTDDLVVLTGDFHAQSASDVKTDPYDLESPVVAAELMAGAISSQFPLDVSDALFDVVTALNPQIKRLATGNGYVVCHVTAGDIEAGYWTVDDVLDAASPVTESARLAITAGTPGVTPSG